MKDKLKELILKHLALKNGMSNIDLVHRVMGEIGPMAFASEEFHEAYEELLNEREIAELSFTSPNSPKLNIILFIRGTKFLNLSEFFLDGQKSS